MMAGSLRDDAEKRMVVNKIDGPPTSPLLIREVSGFGLFLIEFILASGDGW
jgi:hypothetical protein